VVHHALIGWILLYASRVADDAAQNAIHRLKFGLRTPKSSTRDNGNLVVESWHQRKFGTRRAPELCRGVDAWKRWFVEKCRYWVQANQQCGDYETSHGSVVVRNRNAINILLQQQIYYDRT
jgi:hypothetical protein